MYDVTGVNVFPRKFNGIPPQRTGVTGASPTTEIVLAIGLCCTYIEYY